MSSNDKNALAGAADPGKAPEPTGSEVTEIFPVKFEKDMKDFRAVKDEAVDEVPKAATFARASASTSNSVTGLEDVLSEQSEHPALASVPTNTATL